MQRIIWKTPLAATALALSLSLGSPVQADFITPTIGTYGWDRPTAPGGNATFQAWDAFSNSGPPVFPATISNSPNSPVQGAGTGDPSVMSTGLANLYKGFGGPSTATWNTANSNGAADAYDTSTTSGSFITSGGNIYSPGGVVTPRIIIPQSPGDQTTGTTTILLQLRTQGAGITPSSMLLTDSVSGTDLLYDSMMVLGSVSVFNPFAGTTVTTTDRLYRWDVAGNASEYVINFSADGSSLSLDRVAVDTNYNPSAVPEPSTLILSGLTIGAGWVGRRLRRRGAVEPA